MLRLNMAAPVTLARAVLPGMVARGRGRLLIVGSLGAYLPGPYTATYYATRAFVVSWAEAVAEELAGSGVTVTALCPGPMPTGFQVLKRRWVVERTFAWLGRHRRLSKDYEGLEQTEEAWIYLAMIRLMVMRLAT